MQERVRAVIGEQGFARSHIIMLDALLKLRQVCCDPRLLKLGSDQRVRGSAKLDLLMEMLPALLEEGRRILVFSQFTSMLALIGASLEAKGIRHLILTGDTTNRAAPLQAFAAGDAGVFLISLKAGGVGLNLTTADTVIHYDPWWNPATENQATDRAHRIGQTKPVFVYKLVAAGSIEEKILALQAKKAALADLILSDDPNAGAKFSPQDLEALFAPLPPLTTPD
jgi:SNF2 family DNA or RNA helicase